MTTRRAIASLALVACPLVAALPAAGAPVEPHRSWPLASFGNGFAAAVYDTGAGKLRDLYPHPYGEGRPGRITADQLYDATFGIARGSLRVWLTSVPPVTAAFENGTGILTVSRDLAGGLRVVERWFSPRGVSAPVVYGTLTVRNLSGAAVDGVRVFSLHNFHVGPGTPEAGSTAETISTDAASGAFLESGGASGRAAVALPLVAPTRRSASPSDPYHAVPSTGAIPESSGGPAQDDAISAFQWDLPSLAAGGEATVGVALGVADEGDAPALLSRLLPAPGAGAALDAERAAWKAFHDRDVLPADLAGDRLALARQALAHLAMTQVREPDAGDRRPFGQVMACLPPGGWNRTWPRDQAYAIAALAASGHGDLAAEAVRFLLKPRSNAFEKEVGRPYLVSVCRYYGWGDEESDWNEAGPNIEFDGFGLALWSLAEAIRAGNPGLAAEAWPAARDGIADVLLSLVEPGGLVAADSSIWEVHWQGLQKHFTYTQATSILGLCAAADLARGAGDDARAAAYADGARRVAAALSANLVQGNVLLGNREEMSGGTALDAAAVEAFNWGILPPDGPVATATLDAFRTGLGVPSGHGLRRNDDGGWYDRQEWVFIDLRVAGALRRAGRVAEAEALAGWVVAQSRANLDQIAELYSEDGADYAGAVPMAGFGAGAWTLHLLDPAPAVDVPACLAPPVVADEAPDGAGGADAADPGAEVPEVLDVPGTPDAIEPPEVPDGLDAVAPSDGPGDPLAEAVPDPGTDPAAVPDAADATGPGPSASGGCSGAAPAPVGTLLLLLGTALGTGLSSRRRGQRPPLDRRETCAGTQGSCSRS